MNDIIDTTSTDITNDVWPAPALMDVVQPTEESVAGPTLTLNVAGVLPIDTPNDADNIGLALMADGTVRWVSLPEGDAS
jgi:hypothetical protein